MKPLVFKAQTEWVKPTEFPDLTQADVIAIDLETCDPDLKTKGSGAVVGRGKVVGIAVAVDGYSGYFPFDHEGGGNLEKSKVIQWFTELCACSAVKVFHNAMYDVCWIRAMGIKINGQIIDTMIAASLVNENRFRFDLNSLGWDYCGQGKNEAELNQVAKEWGLDPKADMWKLPSMYVGNYAERDAELTLNLWKVMQKEIIDQDLGSIFELETDLFPCLVDMKFKGVRVDVEAAHKLKKQLASKEEILLHQVKTETGIEPQIWAARSIAKVFDKLGLEYERTLKTQAPSFTKNFLSTHKNPTVNLIAKAREINKAHTTFIDTIIKHEHNGRIHADINQIRSDSGGTVTGRFSYSNPNLQQIPARNKDLGPMIRSLFIPESGCEWGCFDYSQQEPRLVVHYASLDQDTSVFGVKDSYLQDDADFHTIVAEMADIPRDQAKTINLGLFYGMGKAKLQAELGVSKDKADELFSVYHERVPFVKTLTRSVANRAQQRGQIRTLLGRLCRFHLWEPNQFGMHKALPFEQAVQEHGPGIKRAYTYKALNKLIQGSAADMTKKCMLELYKEGIVAHIQVHDELDISVENDKQAKKIVQIMESAVDLEIPNKVDYEKGKNWGDIH
jgi:DNA polymerase I-like protein with 3'-5' exonuclease and polymerase domains|tara:strand:+ start:1 stop:1851 length:1851 start_codon:yes stop_codon:yes gene_type:complete